MNKYQEALEWYTDHTSFNQFNIDKAQWSDETLQELVDKETPMKHIAEHCPTCGESVRLLVTERNKEKQTLFLEVSYCCKCGQAIDWSEE